MTDHPRIDSAGFHLTLLTDSASYPTDHDPLVIPLVSPPSAIIDLACHRAGLALLHTYLLMPVPLFCPQIRAASHTSTILSIALELVIWFTPTLTGNAICYALVGFFLGPMYPIVMMVVVDTLPGDLQGGSIGWIASLGQAGSAIMPLYVTFREHDTPFSLRFLLLRVNSELMEV
jgi:MFS family permease